MRNKRNMLDYTEPLIPKPISAEMEDDSITDDSESEKNIPNVIQERLNNLVKNVTNPTKIIEKITEKSQSDKIIDSKQLINFANGDLMAVLDYIKNNKGSLTIKIEF